jgi:hypothetical protein
MEKTTMATTFTGGCVCGAVRYECSAEPLLMGNCHCRDCQRATGGPYEPALAVPDAALKINGKPKYYATKADSGATISRGFCPECGARMFAITTGMSDVMILAAGSLDDPAMFTPAMDFFTSSAQPWDHMNPALPKFAKMPT